MRKTALFILALLLITAYSVAAEEVKDKSQKLNEKAMELIEAHEVEGAFELLKKAIQSDPNDREAYKNLGLLYCWEQKYPEAIASFQKLIEIAPDYEAGYRNLVLVYNLTGAYKEAIPYGEKALELKPDDYGVIGHLVTAYVTVGEYKKAIEYCNKLIEKNPKRPRPYRFLAMAYDGLGDVAKAREAFEKNYNLVRKVSIYEDAPEKKKDVDSLFKEMRAQTFVTKGDTYFSLGNEDKAIEFYKRAIGLNSREVKAYYNLAKTYEKRGEIQNVISNLRKAIELDPQVLAQLMASSDFESIRDTEEFKNMIATKEAGKEASINE